jgi:hypothetical protein
MPDGDGDYHPSRHQGASSMTDNAIQFQNKNQINGAAAFVD